MSPRAAIARIESCAAAVRNVTSATREATGDQGAGQRVGVGGVVEHDDGDEAGGAQGWEDVHGAKGLHEIHEGYDQD